MNSGHIVCLRKDKAVFFLLLEQQRHLHGLDFSFRLLSVHAGVKKLH